MKKPKRTRITAKDKRGLWLATLAVIPFFFSVYLSKFIIDALSTLPVEAQLRTYGWPGLPFFVICILPVFAVILIFVGAGITGLGDYFMQPGVEKRWLILGVTYGLLLRPWLFGLGPTYFWETNEMLKDLVFYVLTGLVLFGPFWIIFFRFPLPEVESELMDQESE